MHSIWQQSQTPAQLAAVDKNVWRITNLEVQSTAPLLFRTVMVRNDNTPLSRTWWVYTDQTQAEMLGKTLLHAARLTDLEPYVVNGEIRFAGVMVLNTGANQKPVYSQFSTNPTLLQQHLTNDNARIFDLDSVVLNGQRYYSALTVRNTGADGRTWAWALGQSASQIETMVQSGMRVVDLERNGASNYDVVVQQRSGVEDWRYYALSAAEVDARLANNEARLIDIEAYTLNGSAVFDVVMVNKGNELEERVGALMRAQTDGWVGFMVRALGFNSYFGEINFGRSFEPAASLALLHAVHATRQVAQGGSFTQSLQYYQGSAGQVCPANTNLTVSTLGLVIVNALRGGHAEIKALHNLYGGTAIATTASAVNMNETTLAGTVGCSTNATTLRDLGDLFDRVDGGYLLNSTQDFWTLLEVPFYGTGWAAGRLKQVIDSEAAAIGLNPTIRNNFVAAMRVYGVSGALQNAGGFQRSHAAMIQLPFFGNGGMRLLDYVCDAFVADGSTSAGATEAALLGATESMRGLIHDALVTWRDHVSGWYLAYGNGCVGVAGIPQQQGFGVPEIGQALNYVLTQARSTSPFVMLIGASNTSIQGTPLPFNLAPFGASACYLNNDMLITLHGVTTGTGTSSRGFTVPLASQLITSKFFTQFAVFDPAANALGISMTGGLETRLGGQR